MGLCTSTSLFYQVTKHPVWYLPKEVDVLYLLYLKNATLVLVDIIENSFIDNSVAEHVTALLLLWVGQKMSIF